MFHETNNTSVQKQFLQAQLTTCNENIRTTDVQLIKYLLVKYSKWYSY